jgi:hypothetical protein
LTFTDIENTTLEDLAKEGVEFSDITTEQLKSLDSNRRGIIIEKLPKESPVGSNILNGMGQDALNDLIDNAYNAKIKAYLLESWVEINDGMAQLNSNKNFLNAKTNWIVVTKLLNKENKALIDYLTTNFPESGNSP